MKPCPDVVGDASVILFTPIDERHNFTGNCNWPAICQDLPFVVSPPAVDSIGCDHNWNTITDTWYTTIGEAIEQAEDEYKEPVPLGPRNTMPKAL